MLAFANALPLSRHAHLQASALTTTVLTNGVQNRIRRSGRVSMIANPAVDSSPSPSVSTSSTDGSAYDFCGAAFADAVSGEWFGYEVSFSARTRAAQSIPEHMIPDEFKDWDVVVLGFDCLTSTTVTDAALSVRRTRALPSVGCEADAVVPDISEQTLVPRDPAEGRVAGGAPDGSFSAGPAVFEEGTLGQRWSFCLAHPDPNQRARARVEFGRVDRKIGSVIVFIETWDMPYRSGEILPGCGGANSSFAEEPILEENALAGQWLVNGTKWSGIGEAFGLESGEPLTAKINERAPLEGSMLLPRGLSVSVKQEGESWVVEAGWLATDDSRAVGRRTFGADGSLLHVEHVVERK